MKEYKFSDRIVRTSFELVIVKRSESEMERREEINSLLWDAVKPNFYSVPVRDVKVAEEIFDEEGKFIAFRSE